MNFSEYTLYQLKELVLFYDLSLPQIYYLSKTQLITELLKYYSWFN